MLHGLTFRPFDEFGPVDHDTRPAGNRFHKVQVLLREELGGAGNREQHSPTQRLYFDVRSDLRLHVQPHLHSHKFFRVLVGMMGEVGSAGEKDLDGASTVG